MTRHTMLMAGCALLTMSATSAYADCAADIAAFEAGGAQMATGDGTVSKDGSLAPLQQEATGGDASAPMTAGGGTTTVAGGETIAAPEGSATQAEANAESGAGDPAVASDGGANAAGALETGTEADAMGQGEAISKDGSVAPLESAGEAGQDAATAGGNSAGVAMSQQDAEAQQQGGAVAQDTAAAHAGADGGHSGGHSGGQMEALDRAHAALAAGDEAGCAAALEEARSM